MDPSKLWHFVLQNILDVKTQYDHLEEMLGNEYLFTKVVQLQPNS
jgi:hypothetical protein